MSLICPECHETYDENVGCVNPKCSFRKVPSFARGSSDAEKQAFINYEHKKWQENPAIVDTRDQNIERIQEEKADIIKNESKTEFTQKSEPPFIPDNYYTLPWGTEHPGHIVYLVDMSGSMASDGKFEIIKEVIQEVSDLVVSMCKKSTKVLKNGRPVLKTIVKDRVSVSIIAYNDRIINLFNGTASELNLKLKEAIKKNDDSNPFPLLNTLSDSIKPSSMTYTEVAFKAALSDIKEWIAQQKSDCKQIPAPVVIHITDGHPEEEGIDENVSISNALSVAKEIMEVEVPDGKALLFNIHFDGKKTTEPLRFPAQPPTDSRRRFLYEASSPLSSEFCKRARAIHLEVEDGSRFMVSNEAEKKLLVRLIKFGSVVSSTGNSNMDIPKIE